MTTTAQKIRDFIQDEEAAQVWPDPEPIPPSDPVPTLPAELVPEVLRPWLLEAAEQVCVPLELAACPAIVGLSSVLAGAKRIRPWRNSDFIVTPNLWGAIIARPGAMKTSLIKEALFPIFELSTRELKRHKEESFASGARCERIKAELDALKAEMRKTAKTAGALELAALEADFAAKSKEAEEADAGPRRYYTCDATTEKLGEMLEANPRGLLLYRDELAGWLALLERRGREGERQWYLESWNGDVHFAQDRIGRGEKQPELILSIIGGIQPGKLRSYIDGAILGDSEADGLLQRLQLIVWPDDLGKWKQPESRPNRESRQRAFGIFSRLDATCDTESRVELRFDPEAQALADAWRNELEGRLRGVELADFPAFESHLAKYRSLFPSLALIFHFLQEAELSEVSIEPARLAAAWCEFLEAHARKIYAPELQPGRTSARTLAQKIRSGAVTDGATVRDLYRPQWAGLKTPESVEAALVVLCELHWCRIETVDTGGRPSEVVRINPKATERSI